MIQGELWGAMWDLPPLSGSSRVPVCLRGRAESKLIGPTGTFAAGKLACSFWKLASETNSSFVRGRSISEFKTWLCAILGE